MNYFNYPLYLKEMLLAIERGDFDEFSDEYLRENYCINDKDKVYFDIAFSKRRKRMKVKLNTTYLELKKMVKNSSYIDFYIKFITPPWFHEGYEDLLD